ncbi:MAG: DivIVA domain-containing protein [Acidimicrobiales bacterium]
MPPDGRGEPLTPERISRAQFATTFRGFDPDQVHAHLDAAAAALRIAQEQELALRAQLSAVKAAPTVPALDEATLTAALGEETARVLTAAREAAAEMRAKGEESVARTLRAAQDDVARLRTEAEGLLAARTTEAEAAAASIAEQATARAAVIVAEATATATTTRTGAEQVLADGRAAAELTRVDATAAAEAEVARAREEGRSMVHEAQLVRERVLKDLARKRKAARAQLEQLRAGRERLLEAYDLVRRTLDEATDELKVSLTEAKIAADAALRRVESEDEPSVEELEAEVDLARAAGLPIVAAAPPAPPAPVAAPDPIPPSVQPPAVVPAHALPPLVLEPLTPVAAKADPPPPTPAVPPGPRPRPAVTTTELPPLPAEIPPPLPPLDPINPPRSGRRKRGVPDLPPVQLQPMAPRDPVEGMRVLTPAAAVADKQSEPTPAVPVEAPGDVPITPRRAEDPVAPAAVDPAPEPETPTVGVGGGHDPIDVDDLFARIRTARSTQLARASRLLEADPEEGPSVEPAVEAAADDDSSPADDESELERRDGRTDEFERAATRKLKRVLADEQNEVLDGLRRTPAPGLDALFPDGVEVQLARWTAAVADELDAAASAGAAFHGEHKGKAQRTTDLASVVATDLVIALRDRVETSLRDAAGDEDAAADGIRAAYREWKSTRIPVAVRDAVMAAFARGVFASTGDAEMRWLVDDGDVACPDCDDNALAGGLPKGTAFPTGHCHPPAHPGCCCLLVPAR